MSKTEELCTSVCHPETEINDDAIVGEKAGTQNDVKDMRRMGKEQKFQVSPGMTFASQLKVEVLLKFPSATSASSPSLALL